MGGDLGTPFAWEGVVEPFLEPVAAEGQWGLEYDDRTQTVTETSPEGETVTRPYEPAEQRQRAAHVYAARLEARITTQPTL